MLKNPYSKFFPPPNYLEMPSFGIDISDESLKYVKLGETKKGVGVVKSGEVKIPVGIIQDGKINDPLKLEQILIDLKKKEKINAARVSILESQIYLFKMKLPKDGLTSIRESIELSLEEHIPIRATDSIFDYEIIGEEEKRLELLVVVIPRNVIEEYLSVFVSSSILVKAFELEAQAMARAIIRQGDPDTYMVVDFGEKRTVVFIVSRGIVMFSTTVDFGGSMLTNTISKSFKVGLEEAEKMKKDYGLQRNVGNKELFPVLLNTVSILRDEILRNFIYWHTHKGDDGKDNPKIRKIFLCGGDANLIGLADYLSVSMKTKVEMANVWANIDDPENRIPDITFKKALSYASAIGLALGDFEI